MFSGDADITAELSSLHLGRERLTALEEVLNLGEEAKASLDIHVEKLRQLRKKIRERKRRRIRALKDRE